MITVSFHPGPGLNFHTISNESSIRKMGFLQYSSTKQRDSCKILDGSLYNFITTTYQTIAYEYIYHNIFSVTGYTRRMIAYDTKANRFIKCANLKERRMHHSATVLSNELYVTGGRYINGHDVIEDSDAFECYDPKTDTWTSKGSLPFKLFDHGSVTLTCVSQTWSKS